MCVAMLMLPLVDTVSKLLTQVASPLDVAIMRAWTQLIFLVPVVFVMRRQMRGNPVSVYTLVSGVLMAVVSVTLIGAFATLPIATAIAIFFIEPLLLTLLAGLMLREKPGPRRYIAVAIGLIGAIIVIRPNFVVFGPTVFLPVISAVAYALNMIVMRQATRSRTALSFQFGSAVCGAGVMVVVQLVMVLAHGASWMPFEGAPQSAYWMVLGGGALAALAFLLITTAFSKAEASILAPFQYLEIFGATMMGYLVFNNIPDAMTFLGTAIILGSGGYVFYRERALGKNTQKIASRFKRG
ncbi:DMT family transporter [Rhodobacteraceae bacterium]|nr:DMT family transporter [Paracoccaceae bacterium]